MGGESDKLTKKTEQAEDAASLDDVFSLSQFAWDAMKGAAGAKAGDRSLDGARDFVTVAEPPKNPLADAYFGEFIFKEVEPGKTTVAKGDTLEKIARAHLGEDATDSQVQRHMKEIAHVNHLKPKAKLAEGTEITLPGHGQWGDFRLSDGENKQKWTKFSDGSAAYEIERKDKTGYSIYVRADGRIDTEHKGLRPEDNFTLRQDVDGRYELLDKYGIRAMPQIDDSAVGSERDNLARLAVDALSPRAPESNDVYARKEQELARFRADMFRFEARAQEQHLSAEEVAKTYREVARLLEAKDNPNLPVTSDMRIALAREVMSQAGTPTSIDQGAHDTCTVTTVEVKTYMTSPSQAARLVADAATTGEYKTPDGTRYTIGKQNLEPDGEAKLDPRPEGKRSYASQVFQTTAVNINYASHGVLDPKGNEDPNYPPGAIRYEQTANGERLIDTRTGQPVMDHLNPTTPYSSPRLADNAIVEIGNKISGKADTIMLERANTIDGTHEGVMRFSNESEFHLYIATMKATGRLPVILNVNKSEGIFWHDDGASQSGSENNWHVVTITDYDPQSARVYVDNQWGSKADHLEGVGKIGVDIDDLYIATQTPEQTISFLESRIKENKKDNTPDAEMELELLRLKYQTNRLSEENYMKALVRVMQEAQFRWNMAEIEGEDGRQYMERTQAHQKLLDMAKNLSLVQLEQMKPYLSKEEYDDLYWSKPRMITVGH